MSTKLKTFQYLAKIATPFALVVVAFFLTTPAEASIINLVNNGSFETTLVGTPGGYICQAPVTGSTNVCTSNLNGWSSTCKASTCGTSGTVASILYANTGGSAFNGGIGLEGATATTNIAKFNSPDPCGGCGNGGKFLAIDGDTTYNASISQTISGLTVGQLYTLQFWQAAAQQRGLTGPQTEWWDVSFGTDTISSTVMSNASKGFVPWSQQKLTFTAHTTSQVLTFLAMGTPSGLPPVVLLDGVSLVTPEPGSFLLLGGGLLSLIVVKKRG